MPCKFIVFSPSYDPNIGGVIVLHKLCHLLNDLGHQAELYPFFSTVNNKSATSRLFRKIKNFLRRTFKKYKTNPAFNTPIYSKNKVEDNCIVIYPEIVTGNPLNAKNVVRWFLHKPGFHTGEAIYGNNELYFDFNSFVHNLTFSGSRLSETRLYINHVPTDKYNLNKALEADRRFGTAYCLRKGKDKKIVHELEDSILIDGKSHKEISDIFKSVHTFISYDVYTAYSPFAVLCGAKSIVVPDKGVSIDEWHPNEVYRHGVSYGFSKEEEIRAERTKHLVLGRLTREESKSINKVEVFVRETTEYFGLN